MNKQRGKMTFLSLIAMAILVIGGYMAFKYIGTNLEKKQIKKEVFDTLGVMRGADRGRAELNEAIENILKKRKVEILEVNAEVDRANVIHYNFKYKIETDYLFFKKSEIVEVIDQIENYG